MLLLESVETLTSRSLTLSLPFVFQLKVSAWEAPQAPSTTPLLAPMTPAAVGAASWAQAHSSNIFIHSCIQVHCASGTFIMPLTHYSCLAHSPRRWIMSLAHPSCLLTSSLAYSHHAWHIHHASWPCLCVVDAVRCPGALHQSWAGLFRSVCQVPAATSFGFVKGACHAYAMPRAPITWCSGASTLSP
eukprot:scaffold30750_cov19-Tisochrysis_lutea.AAC.2